MTLGRRVVFHPLPTINEPHKAMSWLTPDPDLDEGRVEDLFLRAGLARVDNVFMKTRRLFNALERPIGTSSGHNRVWHGYAPYNPAMLTKYLTIFRAVHNFVFVGETDKRTPAMRLGFAKAPLTFEDLIWPGERCRGRSGRGGGGERRLRRRARKYQRRVRWLTISIGRLCARWFSVLLRLRANSSGQAFHDHPSHPKAVEGQNEDQRAKQEQACGA